MIPHQKHNVLAAMLCMYITPTQAMFISGLESCATIGFVVRNSGEASVSQQKKNRPLAEAET